MTSRARSVFLAVPAMAAVPGLRAVDGVVVNPVRSQPVLAASRGLPFSMAVIAVAFLTRGRLRSMTGPLRLVDVGDAWRALLLGAPPVVL